MLIRVVITIKTNRPTVEKLQYAENVVLLLGLGTLLKEVGGLVVKLYMRS